MADQICNISKGRWAEFHHRIDQNDPTNAVFVWVLLKVAEADDTLEAYDTLSALLAGSNTEADFTSYARKTRSDTDLAAISPDDTNDWMQLDINDETWSSAGGASNNTLVKAILCYDSDSTGGTDANIVPVAHYDFSITTNGGDLTLQVDANGYARAA